jgi:ribosome-binding ATPase YchF (GTP1/OBG family)
MKICCIGFDLPEGKVKYQDELVITLDQKLSPKKISPFYVEFTRDDFSHCDGFLVARQKIWDLLILDLEKLEARRDRTADSAEKELLDKCLRYLEQEVPLCDVQFTEAELTLVKVLAPLSLKPTLIAAEAPEVNDAITQVLKKSGIIFFYTADKKEVHAWPVQQDSDIVTCAGKIHSDLARGFIKADIVNYDDFMQVYNMQEARSKGLVKLVDRDYTIHAGDIIEIRFNV